MKPLAVVSTALAAVAYDPAHEVLQLEFRDGTRYQYFRVPAQVHQALLRAGSKGHYFNQAIRGRFVFTKLHRSLS